MHSQYFEGFRVWSSGFSRVQHANGGHLSVRGASQQHTALQRAVVRQPAISGRHQATSHSRLTLLRAAACCELQPCWCPTRARARALGMTPPGIDASAMRNILLQPHPFDGARALGAASPGRSTSARAPLGRLLGGGGVQGWLRRLGGLQGGALCGAAVGARLLCEGGRRLLHVLRA